MYDNIGGKIKIVAVLAAIAGATVCIIAGANLIQQGSDYYNNSGLVASGCFLVIGGSIGSWIASFVLYGFGELIEKTQRIHAILSGAECSETPGRPLGSEKTAAAEPEKLEPVAHAGGKDTWVCKCGTENATAVTKCGSCGKAHRTWKCACGYVNEYENKRCAKCGKNWFA